MKIWILSHYCESREISETLEICQSSNGGRPPFSNLDF